MLQINSGFGSVRDLKLSDRFHNYGVYEFTWSNVLLSWDGEGDTFPRSVVDVPAARVGRRGAGAGERGVRVRRCGLQLREQRRPDEGAVGHHTVALRRAPDADVTVAIESSDPDAVAVTPASLDLATTKWSAQPVAATAVADATATRRRFGSRTPARGCRRARSR